LSWLLDTNVASQLIRPQPNERALNWINRHAAVESRLFLSAVTVAELRRGALILTRDNSARSRVLRWLDEEMPSRFRERIIPFDHAVAARWAEMSASMPKGYNPPVFDSILAATALRHDLVLATGNVKDFERVPDLKLENPFA
jgi:predicted nucleic acid-binding protein